MFLSYTNNINSTNVFIAFLFYDLVSFCTTIRRNDLVTIFVLNRISYWYWYQVWWLSLKACIRMANGHRGSQLLLRIRSMSTIFFSVIFYCTTMPLIVCALFMLHNFGWLLNWFCDISAPLELMHAFQTSRRLRGNPTPCPLVMSTCKYSLARHLLWLGVRRWCSPMASSHKLTHSYLLSSRRGRSLWLMR